MRVQNDDVDRRRPPGYMTGFYYGVASQQCTRGPRTWPAEFEVVYLYQRCVAEVASFACVTSHVFCVEKSY